MEDWLSDYVVSILKSPTWVLPIAQFADEHCDIFDDEKEENNFEFTRCHNEFKQLVNDLLVAHLLEVSVLPEEFDKFCQQGLANNKQLHRTLVEQLLAVDDFMTFKAMMSKQNADLCREVVTFEHAEESDEECASPTLFAANELVSRSISKSVAYSQDWDLYEDQFHATLMESKGDVESLEALARCEEAELEQVIALSLQLEEERLRQIQASGAIDASDDAASACFSGYGTTELNLAAVAPPALPPGAGFYSQPLCALPPKPKLVQEVPRMVQVEPMVSAPIRSGPWGFTSAPLLLAYPTQPPEEPQATLGATAPFAPPAAIPALRIGGFISSPLCFRPPKSTWVTEEAACSVGGFAAPISSESPGPAVSDQMPQTEVSGMRDNLTLWRERAERAIASRPPSAGFQRRAVRPAPVVAAPSVAGPTDEERRQRAEHLRKQRDLLIQKRQRDRDQQLSNFHQVRTEGPHANVLDQALSSAEKAAASRRLVAELSPGAVIANTPEHADPLQADRMRQALTLQLRQTLLRTMPADAATLDNQLSHLESMRL